MGAKGGSWSEKSGKDSLSHEHKKEIMMIIIMMIIIIIIITTN